MGRTVSEAESLHFGDIRLGLTAAVSKSRDRSALKVSRLTQSETRVAVDDEF